MNNKKTCPNCKAPMEDDNLCKMCGVDMKNPGNSQNKIVGGTITFRKYSNILLIVLFILITLACIASLSDDPEKLTKVTHIMPTILLSGITFFVGIIIIDIGFRMKNLYQNGKKLKGKIVDFQEMKNSLTKVEVPIIEYTVNDTKYRIVSGKGKKDKGKIDDNVEILYNEKNPYDAFTIENAAKYKLFIILGILCFIFAILFILLDTLF